MQRTQLQLVIRLEQQYKLLLVQAVLVVLVEMVALQELQLLVVLVDRQVQQVLVEYYI